MTIGAPTHDVRARIVDAATRLLRDHGAQAVTTRAVASAAGVQAPTIYRHFGDKDGLLDAVAEHVMAGYVAATSSTAARTGDDPVADLRAAWHEHVAFGLAHPELYGTVALPGRRDRSPATTAGVEVLRARVHRVAAAGLLLVDEDRAVGMIHAAGVGTVLTLLDHPTADHDPGLAAEMFDVLAVALLADAPASDPTPRGITAAFATVTADLPGLTDAERALLDEWVGRALTGMRPPAAPRNDEAP